MKKPERQLVFDKYSGRCAYCGCELQKGWNVDHIEPVFRNCTDSQLKRDKIIRGEECIENYNPACKRCNLWKGVYSIELFRTQISKQIERLKRDSPGFRLALDYSIIEPTNREIKFYFETL